MNTGSEATPEAPNSSRARSTEARATEKAADAAHSAVDRTAEGAAKAEERLREAATTGEQLLREKGAEARVSAERAMDHVRQYTRENPLAAAGIAFAAGLVLSRLLSR